MTAQKKKWLLIFFALAFLAIPAGHFAATGEEGMAFTGALGGTGILLSILVSLVFTTSRSTTKVRPLEIGGLVSGMVLLLLGVTGSTWLGGRPSTAVFTIGTVLVAGFGGLIATRL